ncbi:DKNYY domain-containing protein [Aminipila sp.]|uniref:DKNYY domain-containing protein n=1 Tax=Aminipila sp. TaxID=2060095 RepID=UPI00289CBE93|nr:DKNYY domain-containing protein [Aminipila sp.]
MKKKIITVGCVFCCVVMILYLLYSTFKPGYVYENSTWNYVSYDEGVGRRVEPINVNKDEFKVLNYPDFARDDQSVYFTYEKIEGSDPDSFQIINNNGRYRYAKDKNNVYVYASDGSYLYKVINADPNSFEVLEFPYSKDKDDAFCGCLPLFVDDVNKFEVLEFTDCAIMSSAGSFLGTECDSIDKYSEYERNMHEYNHRIYGFITDRVFYSEEGKAKTDKLTYEGYKLVEDKR